MSDLRKMYENGYDKWLENYIEREAHEVKMDLARVSIAEDQLIKQRRLAEERQAKLQLDMKNMEKMKEWRNENGTSHQL